MNIEFKNIRQQLDELFNLNEDQYRISIINDKNDNWTGQWILTKNIAKDDVSYIPQMVEGTLSNSLKELAGKINNGLGDINLKEDIKYFKYEEYMQEERPDWMINVK